MDTGKSKVFAKLDSRGCILRVDGGYTSVNIADPDRWQLIDAGIGDRYNLCQTCYFPNGCLTEDTIPLYRWDGAQIIPRTEAEIQADRKALPPTPPSRLEKLERRQENADAAIRSIMGIISRLKIPGGGK